MKGNTHKTGGICSGIITVSILSKPPYKLNNLILSLVILLGSLIGSLLPDIDTKKSTIGNKLKVTSSIVSKICKHRGFTHSPLVALSFFYILLFIGKSLDNSIKTIYFNFILGLLVGVISHILLDLITVEGIPIFYPFNKKRYHLLKFKTGKNEEFIQVLIILITIFITFKK